MLLCLTYFALCRHVKQPKINTFGDMSCVAVLHHFLNNKEFVLILTPNKIWVISTMTNNNAVKYTVEKS